MWVESLTFYCLPGRSRDAFDNHENQKLQGVTRTRQSVLARECARWSDGAAFPMLRGRGLYREMK